eukprot:scaffold50669_cov26-Tisochrysis_lutea.AAC.2
MERAQATIAPLRHSPFVTRDAWRSYVSLIQARVRSPEDPPRPTFGGLGVPPILILSVALDVAIAAVLFVFVLKVIAVRVRCTPPRQQSQNGCCLLFLVFMFILLPSCEFAHHGLNGAPTSFIHICYNPLIAAIGDR